MPMEEKRVQQNRLKWQCRRGLLELDLVNTLLDLPDNDLWDIVAGRSEDYQPHLKDVVARLRAA